MARSREMTRRWQADRGRGGRWKAVTESEMPGQKETGRDMAAEVSRSPSFSSHPHASIPASLTVIFEDSHSDHSGVGRLQVEGEIVACHEAARVSFPSPQRRHSPRDVM
eukprot:765376-Hanusia_phi.AAC.4